MFNNDKFSNHTYFTSGNTKTNELGEVFVKTGNDYVAQNGDIIKNIGLNYLNLRTGVNLTFGDDDE
jgi:hypothetical protein